MIGEWGIKTQWMFNRFEKVWKKGLFRNVISGELYKVVENQTSGTIHNIEANVTLENSKKCRVRKQMMIHCFQYPCKNKEELKMKGWVG